MSRDPFPTEPQTIPDSRERGPADRLGTDSVEPAPTAVRDFAERASEVRDPASRSDARKPEAVDSTRAYYFRDRTYFLRDSEFTTLVEIGTFRVVDAEDFAQFS